MITLSRRAALLAAAGMLVPSRGHAQPARLTIIFPFSAGGAADAVLRRLATSLETRLGRPVIVENRTGGGGRVAVHAVKDAAADGSTILLAAGAQIFLQPHVDASLGYDPLRDLAPVGQMMTFTQALAVGSQVPAATLRALAEWIRADSARAVFGSPGVGTGAHLAGAEFGRMAGLELRHAAYRGTPAALPDLVSGRLPVYIASQAELMAQHRNGALRILASLDAARSPFTPDVPTFRESGFDVVAEAWFAFYAPAATPRPVLAALEAAVAGAVQEADLRERMRAAGFVPTGTTAEALDTLQRAEHARWGALVRSNNIRLEP